MMGVLKLPYAFVLVLCCAQMSESSLYDPHLIPEEGPFFEGWYLRITDVNKGDSIGLLFGNVLPDSQATLTGPLVFASILRRECTSYGTCRLVSVNGKFNTSDLSITVKGQDVSVDPDMTSPSNFRWQVNDGDHGGYLDQKGNDTSAVFKLEDIVLSLKINKPYAWNKQGTGPEGYLAHLPLPLHWFVFSLRSNLVEYELQNLTSGAVTRGSNGLVHMEKNWGKSFPKKWIWSEGVLSDGTNASFALSGGQVDFSVVSMDAYLIGYRNPSIDLDLSFNPTDSVVSANVSGCSGSVQLTINSLRYRVQINLTGRNETYSSCLYGPEVGGFRRSCVESYDATAYIEVSKRQLFGYTTLDKQTFQGAALEFGGTNVCGNACSGI